MQALREGADSDEGMSDGTVLSGDDLEIVYDWDIASDALTWGSSLEPILGAHDADCTETGIGYASLLTQDSPRSRYEAIMAPGGYDSGGGVPYKVVYGLSLGRNDATIWIEDSGRWFADAGDRPRRAHGAIRVITRRVEAERAGKSDALLSGAEGHAHFLEQITRNLNVAARRAATFAVLLIRLRSRDASKPLDDAMFADALRLLRLQMRSKEMIVRHTGDTFCVLLEQCNAEQAATAAQRLIQSVDAIGSDAEARIGAVLAPAQGRSPDDIMLCAERALGTALDAKDAPFVRFEQNGGRTAAKRQRLASDDLHFALAEGRVVLAMQPIVDAKTRAIVSNEGLIRIKKPDGTLMLPEILVSTPDKDSLVQLLDRRALELSFGLLTSNRRLALSINVSVASLHDAAWQDHLRGVCKLRPDAARRLTIDVAETAIIADLDAMTAILTKIKAFGVKIALDDFGSSHSSFRTLRQLPIDYLKIDGAFAQNLATSTDDRYYVNTLIEMARNLRLPTIAEWVEDETTATALADWGVTYLQGNLFGKSDSNVGVPSLRRAAS